MGCIIHKWDGCRCRKCGKTRDSEHDWNGCKCRKCGRTRNEGHRYIYRPVWKEGSGKKKSWCSGTCRICSTVMDTEHDYRPSDKKCISKCSRCGDTTETHRFQPVPGRCAERCPVCGEERDYMEIALNESSPAGARAYAIDRLKQASMLPEELKENCAKGKHIWMLSKSSPQRFQGGPSSVTYTCRVCGKNNVEVDWGD